MKTSRREMLGQVTGAMAGIAFTGCGLSHPAYAEGGCSSAETPGLSDADRVAMLGDTAAKLLGLKT